MGVQPLQSEFPGDVTDTTETRPPSRAESPAATSLQPPALPTKARAPVPDGTAAPPQAGKRGACGRAELIGTPIPLTHPTSTPSIRRRAKSSRVPSSMRHVVLCRITFISRT